MTYEDQLSSFHKAQATYEQECSKPGSRLTCQAAALKRDDALDVLRRAHEAVHGPVPDRWRPPQRSNGQANDTAPPDILPALEGTVGGRIGFWLEQSQRGGVSLLHRFEADEEPTELGFIDASGPLREAPYLVEVAIGTSATAGGSEHGEGNDDPVDGRPEEGFEVVGRNLTREEAFMVLWQNRFDALSL